MADRCPTPSEAWINGILDVGWRRIFMSGGRDRTTSRQGYLELIFFLQWPWPNPLFRRAAYHSSLLKESKRKKPTGLSVSSSRRLSHSGIVALWRFSYCLLTRRLHPLPSSSMLPPHQRAPHLLWYTTLILSISSSVSY
jgi:hypothetical protein